jgi:hypothetical protein
VLETVGCGAGAELVDGAGAGAELGGASVGDADEPREPDPPEGPDERVPRPGLEAPGDPEPREEDVAGWPGCAVGCAPGAAVRLILWCRWPGVAVDVPAGDADADGSVLEAVVAWLAVWTGAARANRVAKPTAATALSCVARQVRRERSRSPAARAAPGGSSGNSCLSRMNRDRSSTQVKGP